MKENSTDQSPPPEYPSAVPKETSNRPFWPVSVGIHVLLLFVLLFIPAKEYLKQERQERKKMKPEIKRRGEKLDEVMTQIRDITAQRLEGKVALLDAGQDRMADNFEILNKHYQPYADQQRSVAMARMAFYADDTVGHMHRLMTSLQDSANVKDAAKLDNLMKVADEIGNKILVGQEEIRRGLLFLRPDDEELVERQSAAEEGQIKVSQHLGWGLDSARSVLESREKIKELRKEIPELEKKLASAQKKIEDYEKRVERQQEQYNKAREHARERKIDKDEKKRRDQKAKQEERELQKVKNSKGNIFDDRRQIERDLENARRQLVSTEENLEKSEKDWPGKVTVARNIQQAAFYKQRDVVNELYEEAGREPLFADE